MTPDPLKFAQDNYLLIAVAFASGAMLLWPLIRGGGGGEKVNTLRATQLMNHEDAAVLDVRDTEEYAKGHIVNARNVPAAQLEGRLREIEKLKRKPVIVYCERGNRSGGITALLRKNGFEKVFALSGGVEAWRQAGLPLEKA